MHFSNFFRFMEAAEHAFFRSLGFFSRAVSPRSEVVCRASMRPATLPFRCGSRMTSKSGCW